jgi:hypothetical protein
MRELAWKQNKARIWLEDLPDWSYKAIQMVEWNLPTSNSNVPDRRVHGAAVEMMVHSGPMAIYGALGAIFTPEQRTDLRIQILVSDNNGPRLRDTLALKGEVAHIGFPQEYIAGVIDGVMTGVRKAKYAQMLGTGTLSFCHAIHGEVGSSKKVFEMLSWIVVRLLSLNTPTLSDDELLNLLPL